MNAAKVFMEVAIKEAKEIEYLYSNKKSMIPLTKEQQDVYDSSSHCYICSGRFTKEDWKVRDHCHLTGEYSDLYVKTDVLLLSDIFENFRSVCMKADNLDPVWYYTAPGLSWDSMLKFTKVKIELLMDYDIYLFIEKGIRGGISQCSNRYTRANNKFLLNFEPSKPQNFLLYLDANNLYGWAMSQYLPLNDFKWIDFLDVDYIDENGEKGYILEVDLENPESLHDDHSDLLLAPESSVLPPDVKKRDY
ncbi:uncharacterized protein TNCV_1235341 [Trichonephila clavipes]|nr:uncharacterized protein TNCV_1235341 [Trichonephila clavipes]